MSGADAVDVSVLVPVLNEERYIREAVATMQEQRFPSGLELIFLDGGSHDRTRAILEELAEADPRIRVLDNPGRRTPQGLNLGMAAARGEFVARMDAHTHYPPDYLALGVGRLRDGGVAHVSGPQIPRGRGSWSRRVALALSTRLGTGGASFRHAGDGEIEVDSGFTGVWRRETLLEQNGWDEGWPINQDAELAARIRADGGRLVCLPAMQADYIPRDSLRSLGRQYWRYGTYRAKTARRHPASLRRSHVIAPGLVLAMCTALIPGRLGRPGRLATLAYLGAVGLVSAGVGRGDDVSASDVLCLPLVFSCMHLTWGAGFVWGSVRFGPPLQALRGLLRG